MDKIKKFCEAPGCAKLVTEKFCEEHRPKEKRKDNRGSAAERGYDYKWHKFRNWYLSKPENKFCKLHLSPRCKEIADCVDHIIPLSRGGSKYDLNNLQPACLICNTIKGDRVMRGEYIFGAERNA